MYGDSGGRLCELIGSLGDHWMIIYDSGAASEDVEQSATRAGLKSVSASNAARYSKAYR